MGPSRAEFRVSGRFCHTCLLSPLALPVSPLSVEIITLPRPPLRPLSLPLKLLLPRPLPLLLLDALLSRRDQLPGSLLAALLRLRPLLGRRDQLPGVLLAALLPRPLLLRHALLGRRVCYWSASSPRIRLLTRAFSAAVIASHIPR